jgi:hypothetical protein
MRNHALAVQIASTRPIAKRRPITNSVIEKNRKMRYASAAMP